MANPIIGRNGMKVYLGSWPSATHEKTGTVHIKDGGYWTLCGKQWLGGPGYMHSQAEATCKVCLKMVATPARAGESEVSRG